MEHLQHKFQWSTSTIRLIAWDALATSLRRIHRPCLTTKICNDLLPVATRLQKWQHQSHSQCPICEHTETSLHLYTCNEPSRIKWRRQFIKALRDRLTRIKTVTGLSDVLCSCISDWFETQLVLPQNYPAKYHPAIITQTNIGWFHLFTGHISQEWERLQNQGKSSSSRGLLWGTHVVEICLQFSIKLWEQRNTEVHGATAGSRKRIKTAKFKAAILHLQSLQPQTHPDDSFLFDGIGVMLQDVNPTTMEEWILSRRQAIYNSIRKAKNKAESDTHKLYHWYPHLRPSTTTTKRLQNWFQNKLVFEPFSKKKRHKYRNMVQQRLTTFLLPCNLT